MSTFPRNAFIQFSDIHLPHNEAPSQSVSAPPPPPLATTSPSSPESTLFCYSMESTSHDNAVHSPSLGMLCLRCHFDNIVPYIPSINAEAVLRHGPSPSVRMLTSAIEEDIPPLRKYLSLLDQLLTDTSEWCGQEPHIRCDCLCSKCCLDGIVTSMTSVNTNADLPCDPSPSVKALPPIARNISPLHTCPSFWDQLLNNISEKCH
ncbi:hypothetical protein EDD18DRAFT_1362323 [Armillaria luteobubalina]|uniref:Uncharacterized protein n=1 Tax=Armillaria luteobubalina TaxID=153913 RepID=A0AA39PFQ2_9AGAR|nr:hypothetical protein EDD18DRAFT_1362323 [Armillaria luteobubalina]